MTKTPSLFKPGYGGDAAEGRVTPVEEAAMVSSRDRVVALERRLHAASLTAGGIGMKAGRDTRMRGDETMGEYLHEFADKVGQEAEAPSPPRFAPTAAQVSDMLPALKLVEGLSQPFLEVLRLKALWAFHDASDFDGNWSWERVGEEAAGLSDVWARRAYEQIIVQAARRAGILPRAPNDHAIVIVAVKTGAWRSFVTTDSEPMQTLYEMRRKSPLGIEAGAAIWVAGKPLAARVVRDLRDRYRGRLIHSSWFHVDPNELASTVIDLIQSAGGAWEMKDLDMGRRAA